MKKHAKALHIMKSMKKYDKILHSMKQTLTNKKTIHINKYEQYEQVRKYRKAFRKMQGTDMNNV